MAGEIRPACGYPDRRRIEGHKNRLRQLHCTIGPTPPRLARHRPFPGTSTFRSREQGDGALWFHFDQVTLVYALAPTTITVPAECTAVHALEGYALLDRAGQPLKIEGHPMYLNR